MILRHIIENILSNKLKGVILNFKSTPKLSPSGKAFKITQKVYIYTRE